jgi:hypothetical protein
MFRARWREACDANDADEAMAAVAPARRVVEKVRLSIIASSPVEMGQADRR